MFPLIDQVGTRMNEYVRNEVRKSIGRFCTSAADLSTRYTIDDVSNCALGVDGRSFEEADASMRSMWKKVTEPSFSNGLKQFLVFVMPTLARFFSVLIVPKDVTEQLKRLLKDVLKYRSENRIVRNDFLDDLKSKRYSIDDMVVLVGGFFLDGAVTSGTAMNLMLYELAVNEKVQDKLREEIDKIEGRFTYEAVQQMSYLDAFVSESLRKYPPIPVLLKICTKTHTFPSLTIPAGTTVVIPIKALHNDEKYFPDPHTFDPDRFSRENAKTINKYTYLPFGAGPRTCAGMNFGMMQLKVGIAKLISEFEVSLNRKTKTPIEFDPQAILLTVRGGVWVDFSLRKK